MKIALVCDWLVGMRGGERCLEAVCQLYPDADIFTLVHIPGSVSKSIESHRIYTSYIQKLPGNMKKFRRYLPLFFNAIHKFDLRGYDVVLSFSHCVAKSISVPKGVPHICYCHTPMRYAWHMRDEYIGSFKGPKKIAAAIMLDYLQKKDKDTTAGVTHFIANSRNVQNRIKDAYNRDSEVICPPVNCDCFTVCDEDDGYYLVLSALVPYKRVDIAVEAFNGSDKQLLIVGNGPELSRLKSVASSNVTFIENATDAQVAGYLQRCRALLFPGEEDFGIVPLEAQACGKPVIAFARGGAMETVIAYNAEENSNVEAGATGFFFYEQDAKSLMQAISQFEKISNKILSQTCYQQAQRFDRSVYQRLMKECVISHAIGHCKP